MRSSSHFNSSGWLWRWSALALGVLFICVDRGEQPQFTNASIAPDGLFEAQLVTELGQDYTIEVSTNLLDWRPHASFSKVATNPVTVVGSPVVVPPGRHFYRARVGSTVLFRFSFNHSALGKWRDYPISFGCTACLVVDNDTDFPAATNVLFTGPAGSGLTNAPAVATSSVIGTNRATYGRYCAEVTTTPTGLWTVTYKGTNLGFSMGNPDAAARLVIPDARITELPEEHVRLDWTYRDTVTGDILRSPPAFMTQVRATLEGVSSPFLSPSTTHWILHVGLSREPCIEMVYRDALENTYEVHFPALPP
jgi:hypothetical protein